LKDRLHIIAFDVPRFPLYGGTVDIYYKVFALASVYEIELHCYRSDSELIDNELELKCDKVHYYKRNKKWYNLLSLKPFIVKSRNSRRLLDYLNQVPGKILFEGIHTTAIANGLDKSRIILRTHNVEKHYYNSLSSASRNLFKKVYYYSESVKLSRYELNTIKLFPKVATISESDSSYFSGFKINCGVVYPFNGLENNQKLKDFETNTIVYFGNFSVEENENAAKAIIKATAETDFNVKLLGSKFSHKLIELCKKYNVQTIHNPSDEELNKEIQSSEFTILISDQSTGIKLKLIRALHFGNKIILSKELDPDNLLNDYCLVQERDWILDRLKHGIMEYPEELLNKDRSSILGTFSDEINGQKLKELIIS
jgi:hypothetical protein